MIHKIQHTPTDFTAEYISTSVGLLDELCDDEDGYVDKTTHTHTTHTHHTHTHHTHTTHL